MNPQEIIRATLGAYLREPTPAYPGTLPADLAPWHCYTVDGGHSILATIPLLLTANPTDPDSFLVPIPVKSVLRGYELREPGYVLALSPRISYDRNLGLVTPREDDEY